MRDNKINTELNVYKYTYLKIFFIYQIDIYR